MIKFMITKERLESILRGNEEPTLGPDEEIAEIDPIDVDGEIIAFYVEVA